MLSAPLSAPRAISGTVISASGSTGVPGTLTTRGIEVRAVRPDGAAVLDGPAGDALAEVRTAPHDLVLVPLRPREHRDQLAVLLVRLVDVQRLVGHQVGERAGDAVEQRVEALLREDVVEDLGQAAVGLDERLGPAAALRRARRGQGSRAAVV